MIDQEGQTTVMNIALDILRGPIGEMTVGEFNGIIDRRISESKERTAKREGNHERSKQRV